MVVDRNGKAWFVDESGVRDEKNAVACKQLKGKLLLADTAGRFWCHDGGDTKTPLRYFAAGEWTDTDLRGADETYERKGFDPIRDPAFEVYEDAGGRVIVRTRTGFSVFDGTAWSEAKVFDKPAVGRGLFVEDDQKRVWYHLRTTDDRERSAGLWAFDGKGWTHHKPAGLGKDESVAALLPFADDWFLVLAYPYGAGWTRGFAWSPSRTAAEVAKANPFAGLPTEQLGYEGTDLNGVRYFTLPRPPGPGDDHPHLALDTKRKVRPLTAAEWNDTARQPFASDANGRAVFARTGDPRPALCLDYGYAVGRDAAGRVYYERNARYTAVLWPKQEKANARLTPTAYPAWSGGGRERASRYADLFADSVGTAFALDVSDANVRHPGAVVTWDGEAGKWAETPIKTLLSADWAGPAPPPADFEFASRQWVGHTCGTDGVTLFARVRSKYAAAKAGRKADAADDAPFYVCEAWLHAGGRWSDPLPPADLLKVKRKDLLAEFTAPATPFGPLPVISFRDRLWSADGWKVHAMDRDGRVLSADIPVTPDPEKGEGKRATDGPPAMQAAFARLDDKRLLLAVRKFPLGGQTPAEPLTTYTVRLRAGKLAAVELEEVGRVPLAEVDFLGAAAAVPHLHVTPGGEVLAWSVNHDVATLHAFADGKWAEVKPKMRPVGRSPDGTLWCSAVEASVYDAVAAGKVVLYKAGAKPERVEWKGGEVIEGFDAPAKGATAFELPWVGYGVLAPGEPGEKPTLRVRRLPGNWGKEWRPPPVVSGSGHLLLAEGSVRLFDPKGR